MELEIVQLSPANREELQVWTDKDWELPQWMAGWDGSGVFVKESGIIVASVALYNGYIGIISDPLYDRNQRQDAVGMGLNALVQEIVPYAQARVPFDQPYGNAFAKTLMTPAGEDESASIYSIGKQ